MTMAEIKNIESTLDGDILTLKIDLSKDFGPSKSGKTTVIATTSGNATVKNLVEDAPEGPVRVGINVYKFKDKG